MKYNQISQNDFYAEDVFPEWIELVRKAKTSITIFSPFLNKALSSLLKKSRRTVKIKIITRLDAEYLCGNINKLRVLIDEMSRRNMTVFHLKSLHAKILLIDDEIISIGSQNFTDEGRRNKEVSFASKYSFKNSRLILDIKNWENQGEIVSKEYLNKLQDNILDDCEEFLKKKLIKKILIR